jgi:hypothetical protein
MAEPWDVPVSRKGRSKLVDLLEKYRAAGKDREAGICLARLAHVYKHVGAVGDGMAFPEAAKAGAEAVELLRKTGDKKQLCIALRAAAVPLEVETEPLLEEALAIAREIGDMEEEAWALYGLRGPGGRRSPKVEQAHELFTRCGCLKGQASCLLTMGFAIGNHDIPKLRRAVELFEESGDKRQSKIAREYLKVALMNTEPV